MRDARGARVGRPNAEAIGRMSQAEVARVLGVTRARVSQIEASALRKLRDGLRDWAPEGHS